MVHDPPRGQAVSGRPAETLGVMSSRGEVNWRVTRTGGVAVALMCLAWVTGIAVGQGSPTSVIGLIINLPFGLSIYVCLVTVLFTSIGVACSLVGWPFFTAPSAADQLSAEDAESRESADA